MITWIQRTFQQHFRIIFGLLLFITIVSFVLIYSPSSGIGRAGDRVISRPFFGLNLASQEDQRRLTGDAALSANLQMGYMGLESSQLENYALQRRAALHLANRLHIPAPSAGELADFMKNLRAFAGEDGQFDAKRYASFRDSLKTDSRLTEADVSRVLADDWRTERVQRLLGGPGYVLDGDAKRQLIRADSTWTLAVATVDYASFSPNLKPTDADLAKFYEENSFRYEIPPRVRATYIEFPAADFIGQVNLTDDEVRAYYDANPGRFKRPSAAPDVKIDPAGEFAAVRPQVEAALKFERARRFAAKAASDLAMALYDQKVPASAIESFLAARKLTPKPLGPFTREAGPAELAGSGSPEIASEAFKLGADNLFSDALPTANSAVVLFWQESLPSRKPLLVEVRDKVAADYSDDEKRKLFVELGKKLRGEIVNRLKNGSPFDQAASAAAGNDAKVEIKTFAPFTLRQPPQDIDYSILGTVERLDRGQISEMVIARDKGYLVYATDRKLPDLSEKNLQYPAIKTQLASTVARFNANAYLTELVTQELKKSEPARP